MWFEITNLVVPGWTDDLDMIKRMCNWLAKEGFEDNPLHFSRFFPMHKLTHMPSTPVETLRKARSIALDAGIKHVYIGNVPEAMDAQHTYCPGCGKIVIGRMSYFITEYNIKGDACGFCSEPISGIWNL